MELKPKKYSLYAYDDNVVGFLDTYHVVYQCECYSRTRYNVLQYKSHIIEVNMTTEEILLYNKINIPLCCMKHFLEHLLENLKLPKDVIKKDTFIWLDGINELSSEYAEYVAVYYVSLHANLRQYCNLAIQKYIEDTLLETDGADTDRAVRNKIVLLLKNKYQPCDYDKIINGLDNFIFEFTYECRDDVDVPVVTYSSYGLSVLNLYYNIIMSKIGKPRFIKETILRRSLQ